MPESGSPRRVAAPFLLILVLLLVAAGPAQAETTVAAYGHAPDAVVDRDGVTHLVWSEYLPRRPAVANSLRYDVMHYCQLPRGLRTCAPATHRTFTPCVDSPEVRARFDNERGGLDSWGPRVMVTPFGEVILQTARFCIPTDYSNSNVRIEVHTFFSADNGETFEDKGWTGHLPMGVDDLNRSWRTSDGPIGYEPARSIVDSADRRVLSTSFTGQAVSVEAAPIEPERSGGTPQTSRFTLATTAGQPYYHALRHPEIVQRGRNSFVAAWNDYDWTSGSTRRETRLRMFTCDGCNNAGFANPANWSAVVTVPGITQNARLVSGPAGTFVLYQKVSANIGYGLFSRRITGTTLGEERGLSDWVGGWERFDALQEPSGQFHAVASTVRLAPFNTRTDWLGYLSSTDGGTWSAPPAYLDGDRPLTDEPGNPIIAARTGDDGLIGYAFWNLHPKGPPSDAQPPIYMSPIPGSGGPPVGPGPGPGPGPSPGPGDPPSSTGPQPPPGQPNVTTTGSLQGALVEGNETCKILQFAAVDVVSDACLKREGTAFVAKGKVKINGLEVAAAEIRFDPKARTIKTAGPALVKVGSTTLFRAPINWTLPKGNIVKLPSFSVSGGGNLLKGFPLKGGIDLRLVRGAVEIPVNVALPKAFGGISGAVTLRADNLAGLHLREMKVRAALIPLGPAAIRNLEFQYNPDEDRWMGGATLEVPPGVALESKVAFARGDLEYLKNELTLPGQGIPLDTFNVTHLTKIRFSLSTKPDLALSGGVTLTAGPHWRDIALAKIDGDLTLKIPKNGPITTRADGLLEVMTIPVARSYAEARSDGFVAFGGSVSVDLLVLKINGRIDGWVVPVRDFSVEGSVEVCAFDFACAKGEALISTIGFAACVDVGFVDVGAGYEWGPSIFWGPAFLVDLDPMFSSCSVDDYRPAKPAGAAQAGAPRSVEVGRDLPAVVLAATGTTGAPHFVATAPNGKTYDAIADRAVDQPDYKVMHAGPQKQTYLVVKNPPPGRWTITEQPDASPIASVGSGNGLPDPKVKAKVVPDPEDRRKRIIEYDITPIEGQKVRFEEESTGKAAGVIGAAKGTKGRLRFSPASGPGGARSIVAAVEQNGRPRTKLKVATYVAPPPPRPAKPRKLKLARTKSGIRVAWKPVPGVRRYRLKVTLSDGRIFMVLPKGRARTVTVPGIGRKLRVRVALQGEKADGTTGPAAIAQLRR
ncbi:MAG: hypothetical protein ACSLFR_10655 [Solirubrobacteraceae bacterium]